MNDIQKHRTPWWWQAIAMIFATIGGIETSGLILTKIFHAEEKDAWRSHAVALIAVGILVSWLLIRERQREHTKFTDLTQREKRTLLLTLTVLVLLVLIQSIFLIQHIAS